MHPTGPLQPVAAGERLTLLDALRGFALFGILLMNIETFVTPSLASMSGLDPDLEGADRIVDALVYFFVQGKFYILFSLLFGMGFAVMSQRAEAAGRPFAWMYLRRSLGLLGIGLAHALLVWSGDILVLYALLSVLLLAFRPVPAAWLGWLGALACLVGPALLVLLGMLSWVATRTPEGAAEWNAAMAGHADQVSGLIAGAMAAYGPDGSYAGAVAQRAREVAMFLSSLPVTGPQVFGVFLLGAAFVRSGAIAAPDAHRRLHATLRWVAMPAGLAVMGASMAVTPTIPLDRLDLPGTVAQALGMLAGVLMGLGLLGWLVRLFGSAAGARLAAWVAPAGRMALTNYLAQSVVCTLLFYGYGLGLLGQLPRAWQLPFVVALFTVQAVASHLWLARMRFGPVEWLWRWLTYLRPQPMRIAR